MTVVASIRPGGCHFDRSQWAKGSNPVTQTRFSEKLIPTWHAMHFITLGPALLPSVRHRLEIMHSCLDGGLHGANVLPATRLHAVAGQPRCVRRNVVRCSILSDALHSSSAKPPREALLSGYSNAAAQGEHC
jgi:hypothetical protein